MTGKKRRRASSAVTQAQLERAKRALQKGGTPFAGYRVWPDGRVDVLAGDPQASVTATVLDEELAQWKKDHGYS
jgi:hypothetical protein